MGGVAEATDRFGSALAAADLNCDAYTDLVVGTPYEDISGHADSGYVQVIWGAASGLGAGTNSVQYTQTDFGQPVQAGDQFGFAVDALEDVGLGGTAAPNAFALAIGAPGGDIGSDTDAGWVGTLSAFYEGGLYWTWSQDSPGIPGSTEPGDRFGASVSLGYLLGAVTIVDLAIGSPTEDVGSISDAGTVTVIRDLDGASGGDVVYDQDSAGVASIPEEGDRFGYSLDSLRTASTTRLAVGVPYEDGSATASSGLAQLFSGDGSMLTAGAGLTQDTDGVGNVSETGDLFGERVAWFRPSVLTSPRLAVSAPAEDGVADNTGLVQVFPVTNLGADVSYTQDSPDVPGVAEAGDKFGAALAVVSGDAELALLVAVPHDVTNENGMVDVIPWGSGTARAWVPGVGGVPNAGSSRFGAALVGAG